MRSLRAASLALALSACAAQPRPWNGATPDTWPGLRQELARLRETRPQSPWAAEARVSLREPVTDRVLAGRGGIAVAPGRALRIIVVGVAGVTLLDAWVTPDRWRVAVPAAGLVRRGQRDAPADLPIDLLRWWFFWPLRGELFAASPERVWLLRDGGAVLELRAGTCDRGQRLRVSRSQAGHVETVDECRSGVAPAAGDHVHYEQAAPGVSLEVALESVTLGAPNEEAFADPDAEVTP